MPTKAQKCIYGIASVPFILIQYWKDIFASGTFRNEKSAKKQRRNCGSFAVSLGILLILISTLSAGDSMIQTLLITLIASLCLLHKSKITEMLGFTKNSLAAGLLFTAILPSLACLFLYYKGWLWATGLFVVILMTTGIFKLLHIMSNDFCKNHLMSLIRKMFADFLGFVESWIQIFNVQAIRNSIYEPVCEVSGYLSCKSAVQKRE